MNLLDRFICAFERRDLRAERDAIYHNDLDVVAAGRLVVISARLLELGDKPRPSVPHLGEESERMVQIVNDEATPAHHWHGYKNSENEGRGKR